MDFRIAELQENIILLEARLRGRTLRQDMLHDQSFVEAEVRADRLVDRNRVDSQPMAARLGIHDDGYTSALRRGVFGGPSLLAQRIHRGATKPNVQSKKNVPELRAVCQIMFVILLIRV